MTGAVKLQTHLFAALLDGKTADVTLRVWGATSWHATYRLHRVILIQSSFFQSLFTAGFEETYKRQEIDIVFDDENITRAAFEICIGRLYGGGPPLHVSAFLRPTPSHPLTPAFPHFNPPSEPDLPPGHHPATPRILMSLLATAIYLSIPTAASQAVLLILNSIGPTTALKYLNFALGKPIEDIAPDEPSAAVGLESLADLTPVREKNPRYSRQMEAEGAEPDATLPLSLSGKRASEVTSASLHSNMFTFDASRSNGPLRHYGPFSDKIGEAAACWLARWAPDMLALEEQAFFRRREKSLFLTPPSSGSSSADERSSHSSLNCVPTIWGRGGLDAVWVSGLVSSDTIFVRSERDRYDFARRVVEMRRMDGIDKAEEDIWADMFSNGIYYANMLFDDLIHISEDISPTTGRPFVPISVLQAATWNQNVLQHRILMHPATSPTSSSPSPNAKGKELGLSITAHELATALSEGGSQDGSATSYFPIFGDSSLRLGDDLFADGEKGAEKLWEAPSHLKDCKSGRSKTMPSEANFFGLKAERCPASSVVDGSDPDGNRWSSVPPFRFAVEFWDLELLKEKIRLHSHTVWYAGSLFNVYVQVVQKKGFQLGVYLIRQSSADAIPPSSAPSTPRVPHVAEQEMVSGTASNVSVSRSSSPPATASSPSPTTLVPGSLATPTCAPPVAPVQPYRDPRPAISAYFAINSMSATGSSLTRFTSVPDVFRISQSWGWKSSYLGTGEYLEATDGSGGSAGAANDGSTRGRPEISFRATIVLGLV